MSGVIFVVYIPTPEEELKLKKSEQKLKNEGDVEINNEKNTTKQTAQLQAPGEVKQSFDNNGYDKQDESRNKYLTYRPLQPASPNDLIDLAKESKDQHEKESNFKEILSFLLEEYKIQTATWSETPHKSIQILFSASLDKCEDILDELLNAGIGKLYQSNVSVLPCTLHYEPDNDFDLESLDSDDEKNPSYFFSEDEENKLDKPNGKATDFMKSIKARLTVAQVVEGVRANASFTFDFVVLILLASMIAAMGLVENSPVALVASMLVSPLMGPILAGTFGAVINDISLKRQGLLHELIGLGLCIVFGFVFGIVCGPFNAEWGNGPWPTVEMTARGHWRSLWVGALIAIPSGAGVALSVLGGNMGCLVGVAISASLLPPAVNAGVLWGLSVVLLSQSFSDPAYLEPPENYTTIYYDNMAKETAVLGVISLTLTLLNIACIVMMGILVLRVKEVAPGNSGTRRFWKHDIRVTRNYNKTVRGHEGKQLSEKFLQEWSELNKGTPDDKKLERKLSYMIQRYQNDPTLKNVARYSCYRPPERSSVDNPYITWHNPKNYNHLGVPENHMRQRHFSQVDHNYKPRRSRGFSLFNDPLHSRKTSRMSNRDIGLSDIKENIDHDPVPKRKDSRFTITKTNSNL